MKKSLLSLLLLIVVSSCAIHKESYKSSSKDIVSLKISGRTPLAPKQEGLSEKSIEGLIPIILKPVAKFTVKFLKDKIDAAAEKHIANYSAGVKGKGFYNDGPPNQLTFERYFNKDKKEPALKLVLGVEYLEEEAFLILKANSLIVRSTKAKIFDKKEETKFIIKADVKLKSAWRDHQKFTHIETVGEHSFIFEDVEYGTAYSRDKLKNKKSDIMFAIPKSYKPNGEFDAEGGNYEIEITITEIDKRKKIIEKASKLIEDNNDEIVDTLVDLIYKDKEDE